MDVRMPELDGIEATRQICPDPATESVRVVVLTTFDHDEHVYAALRAGASGFLLKDVTPDGAARGDPVLRGRRRGDRAGGDQRLLAEFARRPGTRGAPARRSPS